MPKRVATKIIEYIEMICSLSVTVRLLRNPLIAVIIC
jgi:hypothetical protein